MIVAAVTFSFGGAALADSFLKQVVHADAFEMMGQKQPERNDTTVMWLTEGKACNQTGTESTVILDAEEGVMYMVNHEKKEYSVVPMDIFGGQTKSESETDEQTEMMKMAEAMMGSTKITVTPTDETRKIGDWNCKKYDVEMSMAMMTSKQELWASEEIEVDYAMFQAVSDGMMAQMPIFGKIVEEMKQVKGIPVMTVICMSMMGQEMTTTTELIEFEEKDAPDGTYDVPEGYKEVKMGMGGH